MKKTLFAFALIITLAACTQDKASSDISNTKVPTDPTVAVDVNTDTTTTQEASTDPSDILYNADGTIDTSNWKTYTNEEYSFSVKYPESWRVKVNANAAGSDKVTFYSGNKGGISFSVLYIEDNNDRNENKSHFNDYIDFRDDSIAVKLDLKKNGEPTAYLVKEFNKEKYDKSKKIENILRFTKYLVYDRENSSYVISIFEQPDFDMNIETYINHVMGFLESFEIK